MKEQKISLSTAILLNMNIMIGSGALIGPGAAAAISGNASFLTWPLVALFFLPIVLCTIELSRLFPGAGGFYLYAKEGLNQTAGFASGWLYIIGYVFAATVETLALRDILLIKLGSNIITSNPIIFNALIIGAVVIFNHLSLKVVGNFLNSLTIVKILPLLILIGLLPFIFKPSFCITSTELALLPSSLALPIFGFFGFEACVGIAHLIKDHERNAPLAIMIGFLGTGLLYMLFHFGLLNLMGAHNLATFNAPAFADFITLPVPYLKSLLKILIPTASVLIYLASLVAMINSNAIMLQSMAEQKILKGCSFLTWTNAAGRPWTSLLLQGVVVFLIATLIPSLPLVGGLTILSVLLSFLLPFTSLLVVEIRKKNTGKIILAVLGLIVAALFSAYSWYILSTNPNFHEAMKERLTYTAVLAGAFAFGMLIFNKKK